jgi:hypothetical protein
MSKFLSRLVMQDSDFRDDGEWTLVAPLVYQSDVAGQTFTIPVGFQTDLASVPRVPIAYWLTGGTANMPAVVHDWLYTFKPIPRWMCDAVLKEASAVVGVEPWRYWLMWAGVRIGGWAHWK